MRNYCLAACGFMALLALIARMATGEQSWNVIFHMYTVASLVIVGITSRD